MAHEFPRYTVAHWWKHLTCQVDTHLVMFGSADDTFVNTTAKATIPRVKLTSICALEKAGVECLMP